MPVFFGTSGATTLLTPAYKRLKARLGIKRETRAISRAYQYARVDEEVWRHIHSDGRPLFSGAAPAALRRDIPPRSLSTIGAPSCEGAPGRSITSPPWRRFATPRSTTSPSTRGRNWATPAGSRGCAEARGIQAMDSGRRPERRGCIRVRSMLRGMDTGSWTWRTDPDFAHAMLRKVTDLMSRARGSSWRRPGGYIDVLVMGDDLGTQNATLISPGMYREISSPITRNWSPVHARSKAKVFFHSDGNIFPLPGRPDRDRRRYPQPRPGLGQGHWRHGAAEAPVWQSAFLLRRDRHPAGAAQRHDRGREAEVRRRIKDLAPGGGYICAAVHCIQPDVPVENVLAMYDEAAKVGGYPLAL